jgi:hypothetical protein
VASAKLTPILTANAAGHNGDTKDSWTTTNPRPHHKAQIIGDSNLGTWGHLPLPMDFNIDAFGGCHLADVTGVLNRSLTRLSTVGVIVLAVGINDREESPERIVATLKSIDRWRKNSNKRVVFSSVPVFRNLPSHLCDRIDFINNTASDIFGEDYVTCCEEKQVHLKFGASKINGIHYSIETADIIIDNLINYLND